MSEEKEAKEKEKEEEAIERCKIAAEIALRTLIEECRKTSEETMKKFGAEFMGLSPEDVPNDYKEVLKVGLTREVCVDFRAIRRFVLSKAWDIMEKEKEPFSIAIKKAWDFAKIECAKLGAVV